MSQSTIPPIMHSQLKDVHSIFSISDKTGKPSKLLGNFFPVETNIEMTKTAKEQLSILSQSSILPIIPSQSKDLQSIFGM